MHFLNPTCLQIASSNKNATFTSEAIDDLNITNNPVSTDPFTYNCVPHSEKSCKANNHLDHIHEWFVSLRRPEDISNKVYATFLRYCAHFFIKDDHLWKKDLQGHHKLVIEPNKCPTILVSAHDEAGHHGDFATCAQIIDCFWWPDLATNIAWFVKTCHLCQLCQTCNILIPPVVATPTPLFAKMYMDMMHLLKSGGFKYLVQGHCSLTHYPEYRILHTETAKTIGNWIFFVDGALFVRLSQTTAPPSLKPSTIWASNTTFATFEYWGITLMQMASWKGHILMFTKCYSGHATVINLSGIQWSLRLCGQIALLSADAWVVLLILQ